MKYLIYLKLTLLLLSLIFYSLFMQNSETESYRNTEIKEENNSKIIREKIPFDSEETNNEVVLMNRNNNKKNNDKDINVTYFDESIPSYDLESEVFIDFSNNDENMLKSLEYKIKDNIYSGIVLPYSFDNIFEDINKNFEYKLKNIAIPDAYGSLHEFSNCHGISQSKTIEKSFLFNRDLIKYGHEEEKVDSEYGSKYGFYIDCLDDDENKTLSLLVLNFSTEHNNSQILDYSIKDNINKEVFKGKIINGTGIVYLSTSSNRVFLN